MEQAKNGEVKLDEHANLFKMALGILRYILDYTIPGMAYVVRFHVRNNE